jgi:mono/diheme cytochrome c family protein
VLIGAWGAWAATPGLPIWWGPRASAEAKAAGLVLFEHDWEPHDPMAGGDGLGPVFNARSCAACHFQGGVGGGGGNGHNVLTFEAHPTKDRPQVQAGLIHAFAVEESAKEGHDALRRLFPVVPNGARVERNCFIVPIDFDPIRTEKVNSTALFGAGWVDRIPGKTISHESMRKSLARIQRELGGRFDGVSGRPRVLPDGRVGKFGWKAQFATLEEFVAAACANEIGLGNPRMEQARPLGRGTAPSVDPDLDAKQFRSLVAFVETLSRPGEVSPESPIDSERAVRGKALFTTVGCAECHTPDMGGVAGVYSDFMLHRVDDRHEESKYGKGPTPDVPLPTDHPQPEEWKTPLLWGVADSSPYFHDGGSPTLLSAILRHKGEATGTTSAFQALPADDRAALLAFLNTLKAPAEARAAPASSSADVALAR